MTTNYERIKAMSVDEMAEFSFFKFKTQNKEICEFQEFHIGYDGKPYKLLHDLIRANREWLQSEVASEADNDR